MHWEFCICVCLLCITLCPLQFCNHFEEEEKAGCFAIIVLQMYITITVLWLFLTVPWVGLQYVFVVFPDHTHLRFGSLLMLRHSLYTLWFNMHMV